MNSNEVRERFLAFFAERGHRRVASSPLVPGSDPTLMFTNAGMIQFKDVLLGFEKRPYDKAVTSQRCLRAGGKHNDLENVGYTARHHTFFEMLGNFSFGDYFKERAIPLAWQLLTDPVDQGGYGLNREHLWVTIFGGGHIFGADHDAVPADEQAAKIWSKTLQDAGFSEQDAARRITRIPTSDNFWMMGDTGPCGPCSEIFYNRNLQATSFEGDDEAKADSCVEIWNLVFMQFNRDGAGALHELPKPCIDTGMGLERLCAVLQDKTSNFDTDLFAALVAAAQQAVKYAGGKAKPDSASLRVIADHIRAAAYLIADQVLPSNEGRGYVLRRIIRRALRHGYQLGVHRPFFANLAGPLAKLMGDAHPELPARLAKVTAALLAEEEQFSRTLHDGMKILTKHAAQRQGAIDAATAFKLYDTYGFPVDLTASYARDHGLQVDMAGFERELEQQRRRSRAAAKFNVDMQAIDYTGAATRFERDPSCEVTATVVALYAAAGKPCDVLQEGQSGVVVLDATGFYAESGGQVGDQGALDGANEQRAEVLDTVKIRSDVHGHQVRMLAGDLAKQDAVICRIDRSLRAARCRAHSAAHLLHEALRRRLGEHVEQRGSLVDADRLRFDFVHDAQLSADDLAAVEQDIYAQVLADAPVQTTEMPLEDALKTGARALFGEKYGAVVRVVQIDPNYSVELCAGTHVGHASQIGLVHVQADESIAAGIRRIEAYTGLPAQQASRGDAQTAGELALLLKRPKTELVAQVTSLREQLKAAQKSLTAVSSAAVQARTQELAGQYEQCGPGKLIVAAVELDDLKLLKDQARSLAGQLGCAAVWLCGHNHAQAGVAAVVSTELQELLSAKQWIVASAEQMGARGGGNAGFRAGWRWQPATRRARAAVRSPAGY